ncbi:MAG TPA: sigma-70 family RNA polymerase sigma factor [Ktedonobacterales bacterium]
MRDSAQWAWRLGENISRRRDGAPADGSDSASDAGELVQFSALLDGSAATMTRIAAALVGTADAEDAAQEAILRAWRAWPALRERDAARAWLNTITVNVCRDWLRGRFGARLRLTESLSREGPGSRALARLDDDPGASDHAAALDLRAAINALEEDLRLIVTLRYYAGLDSSAIGSALGIPAATARTRLRRALGVLRDRLAGSGHTSPDHVSGSPGPSDTSDSTEGRR